MVLKHMTFNMEISSTQLSSATPPTNDDIYILAAFRVAQTSRSRAMILKIPHEPDADAVANVSRLRYKLVGAAHELFPDINYATQITSVKIQWHVALPPPLPAMAELLAWTNSMMSTMVDDGESQDGHGTTSTGGRSSGQTPPFHARQPAAAPAAAAATVEPLEMLYLGDVEAWTQIMGIVRRGSRDVLEVTISAVQRREEKSTS